MKKSTLFKPTLSSLKKAESHFGQNDNLAKDTLTGTLWPEGPFGQGHFGQRHVGRRDNLASVTMTGDTLASAHHFGQSDTLSGGSLLM